VIGQVRFHRGRDAQAGMNAAEVVIREMQRNRVPEIVPLFTETQREARELPDLSAHGQILAFNVGS